EAVARFLADEVLHLGTQGGVQDRFRRHGAYAVDEHLLAQRETHRQGIHERGAPGVAAQPPAAETARQVDVQLADGGHGSLQNRHGIMSHYHERRARNRGSLRNGRCRVAIIPWMTTAPLARLLACLLALAAGTAHAATP